MAETGKKIVRLINTDLNGEMDVVRALRKIKGIGPIIAKVACHRSSVDPRTKLNTLSDEQLKKIEETVKGSDFPDFLKNKRNIHESRHDFSTKIDFDLRENVNILRRIRSYRGIRHELGQPVRGQRTRSTFRKNKTVGVQKKKRMPARKSESKAEGKK